MVMVKEYSYPIESGTSNVREYRDHRGRLRREGLVVTPEGVVEVESERGRNPYSRYRTVLDGRVHVRTEEVARTTRGLAVMARRWLKVLREEKQGVESGQRRRRAG